ncbi:MAG: hypothetical protein JWL90_3026 [Chthoniobacteraceae bacterium]|nr:hypothetical protein [Chthoniobacteraceae bacterium]
MPEYHSTAGADRDSNPFVSHEGAECLRIFGFYCRSLNPPCAHSFGNAAILVANGGSNKKRGQHEKYDGKNTHKLDVSRQIKLLAS